MKKPFLGTVLIAIVLISACTVAKTPPTVEQKARELHRKILTVDTHCDTAMRLVGQGWKIGERHDPSLRASGKIDLPRMREGGLDAEFFAASSARGPFRSLREAGSASGPSRPSAR
jgi:membrane dipeptidase